MSIRIYFAGLQPGRPLILLAWAAFQSRPALTATTTINFGRDLKSAFGKTFRVADKLADCDVVIYPHPYADDSATAAVADIARAEQKPCLFFSQDERLPPSRLSFGTLYRSSIFKRLPHERAHAVFISDVREEAPQHATVVVEREDRPRLGFCGYVGTPIRRAILRLLGARQKVEALDLRSRVLRYAQQDQRLDSHFITRADYLGAATLAVFDQTHPLADARQAFLQNLFKCSYGLAMRGKGNHSVRFYEILAAGRIPVFINTNCVLPFEAEIPWKTIMPWIEHEDIPSIGDRLLRFHNQMDEAGFRDKQLELRALWEARLTPIPYFTHILQAVASGKSAP
jgi:hypothetical protein